MGGTNGGTARSRECGQLALVSRSCRRILGRLRRGGWGSKASRPVQIPCGTVPGPSAAGTGSGGRSVRIRQVPGSVGIRSGRLLRCVCLLVGALPGVWNRSVHQPGLETRRALPRVVPAGGLVRGVPPTAGRPWLFRGASRYLNSSLSQFFAISIPRARPRPDAAPQVGLVIG